MSDLDPNSKRYNYERNSVKGKRVGQAVSDILANAPSVAMTAGDVMEAYQHKFVTEMENCIKENLDKFNDPFYILVLTKKEFWADNVVRNWFIARQTAPKTIDMITVYAHHTKTLYRIHKYSADVDIVWSLPGFEEMKTVLKNPETYDPKLVKWISDALAGNLDNNIVE